MNNSQMKRISINLQMFPTFQKELVMYMFTSIQFCVDIEREEVNISKNILAIVKERKLGIELVQSEGMYRWKI